MRGATISQLIAARATNRTAGACAGAKRALCSQKKGVRMRVESMRNVIRTNLIRGSDSEYTRSTRSVDESEGPNYRVRDAGVGSNYLTYLKAHAEYVEASPKGVGRSDPGTGTRVSGGEPTNAPSRPAAR